ncbi:TetR family transcriptional regulator C-terminal domain-containing protein [Nocardia brasiliensis]|uniref:TetR family transcriptional regulator C-terminal domain-containing protein n=1 Tax=Nocardia brasiliensis TaxID=37326 RepID=UPI000DFE2B97|nr:TetR family transcriptional regulator C-terminal domain-containing protein [Nocardia brasiliensis]SUB47835.1 Uncharacterised protein [Nocardia brasiliensis]
MRAIGSAFLGWNGGRRYGALRRVRFEVEREGRETELLLSAWHHVRAQAAERFRQSGVADLAPADQLLGLTELLLSPTPDDRLTRVWLALVARAAESPAAAAELLALLDGLAIATITEPTRISPERARRIARTWTHTWTAASA